MKTLSSENKAKRTHLYKIKMALVVMIACASLLTTWRAWHYYTNPIVWEIHFKPRLDSRPLKNPLKGFYAIDSAKYDNPPIPQSLAYTSITWADLQPQSPDLFDWKKVEQHWDFHLKRQRKIGLRLKLADPWTPSPTDIPQWLVNKGVRMRPYRIDGGSGLAPDWDNSKLLHYHSKAISALGRRYNKNPKIAWVDVGSYGIWGEWHVYKNPHLKGTDTTKKNIIDAYLRAFPDKPLVIPYGDRFAAAYVLKNGGGLRNDCLGNQPSNEWYEQNLKTLKKGRQPTSETPWKITGEYCGAEAGAKKSIEEKFALNLEFFKKHGLFAVGPAGGSLVTSAGKLKKKIETLHKILGYRFLIKKSTFSYHSHRPNHLTLTLNLANEGTTPFFHDWPVKIFLKNHFDEIVAEIEPSSDEWSPKQWTPGEHTLRHKVTQLKIPPGTYLAFVAILSPIEGEPPLQLAMQGKDTNGFYYIGRFNWKTL